MNGLMDALSIGASGMKAAEAQLSVTANNIANADIPGYQSKRADLVELSGGGVAVSGLSTDTTPGAPGPDGKTQSNVDLATESVNMIREKVQYDANAAVVRAGSHMLGSLLDMFDSDHGSSR